MMTHAGSTTRVALLLAAGCQGFAPMATAQALPVQAASPTAGQVRESYVLGKGDMVEVSVLGRPDYVARVQVQEDGTILLPLINSMPAAGRSVLGIRDQIRTALINGGFFASPAVNVTVVSFASRYVTVLGQVNTPGVVPIDRAYRLSEILARAGGANGPSIDTITLTRATGESADYAISALATGAPGQDPFVSDGDKVFVAPAKIFYVYGQVNAPGSYPIERDMTLRMALARSGGLTALGSERLVKLIRGTTETKRADLSATVQPGDVIVIGERFF